MASGRAAYPSLEVWGKGLLSVTEETGDLQKGHLNE